MCRGRANAAHTNANLIQKEGGPAARRRVRSSTGAHTAHTANSCEAAVHGSRHMHTCKRLHGPLPSAGSVPHTASGHAQHKPATDDHGKGSASGRIQPPAIMRPRTTYGRGAVHYRLPALPTVHEGRRPRAGASGHSSATWGGAGEAFDKHNAPTHAGNQPCTPIGLQRTMRPPCPPTARGVRLGQQ